METSSTSTHDEKSNENDQEERKASNFRIKFSSKQNIFP